MVDEQEFENTTPAEGEGAAGAAPEPAADAAKGAASDDISPEDRALLEGEAEAYRVEREALEARAAEHLSELQRLKAEYVNYRARVERERAADKDATIASVVQAILPALDDLDLADKHGDLVEGPLSIVAQKLRGAFTTLGLERVGVIGEAFDPAKHEAIAQVPNPEATEMTVLDVIQVGYRIGDRLLRPAKVAVQVPAE